MRWISFDRRERGRLGLEGLLPYGVSTEREMVHRMMVNLERLPRDIDRYLLLSSVQERNERLFYRTVIEHIERILPLIYTPTVGEACKEFSHIAREPKGFFITPADRGRIHEILGNWPQRNIRAIVVTDGQRILGLGDLGANGMGIPIGKLALYTACAGIDPETCLPVTLDVGTNNDELRKDVLYLGYPRQRIAGRAYLSLVDEFVAAVQARYPDALLQFEDFLTPNAYALLHRYRDRVLCFNDDIQGTAAVALAGVYTSTRITGVPFRDLRIMFLGAGSAAPTLVRGSQRPRREGAHRSARAQPAVRARSRVAGVRRGDRRDQAARADRRDGRPRHVHAAGRRTDEPAERPAGDLRAVEPDVEG
jgi:malate dehydrogenase (oxaloacetate-decarboxylating)(NADP+)